MKRNLAMTTKMKARRGKMMMKVATMMAVMTMATMMTSPQGRVRNVS